MMLSTAIIGTARNAPASHQSEDQNISASIITKVERLSLFHIIFGSRIFHEISCGIMRQARRRNDNPTLSNCTKEYKNGSPSAIIPHTAGIKSKRKTKSPNIKAYSSQNINIITMLTIALKSASANFERKNTFTSS